MHCIRWFDFGRDARMRMRDGLVMLIIEHVRLLPETREYLIRKLSTTREVQS